MKRLLLLEDDESLGETLSARLQVEGYEVVWAKTCADALASCIEERFDLGIFDVGLPDGTGFSAFSSIPSERRFPVMFLTAMNSAEYRLEGFELGAADYVPKPFHLKELLLRIKKIVEPESKSQHQSKSGFKFLSDSYQVIWGTDEVCNLPQREFELLLYLVKASPRCVERAEIVGSVFRSDSETSTRTVDNSILKIRNLLGDKIEGHLRSVRGIGYQWID